MVNLYKKGIEIRIDLVEMLSRAQAGYLGGSLSSVDILTTLYFGKTSQGPIMGYDPSTPGHSGQDYFILGKGHASAAWYVTLAHAAFFDRADLQFFTQIGSDLGMYANKKIPGVTLPATAPGYGLSAAVGLAMALKSEKAQNRVYCLIGDGDLQRGVLWEAAEAAAHYKLDNLTLIVDTNGLQADGLTRGILGIDSISDKFDSFGFKTIPVYDGHNNEALIVAFERAIETLRKPSVIIAKTVKGKGVEFTEGKAFYHHEILSPQELAEALPRLKSHLQTMENIQF